MSSVDLIPAGIVTCDGDARIERVNAQLLSWLGLSDDGSLRGRPFHELLAPAGKIYFETHIRPMLVVEGRVSELSLELKGPAGARRRIYLNGQRELSEDGSIRALHFACFDGSQRFAYEQELLVKRRGAEAYGALVDASPDAIIHTDSEGAIRGWNQAATDLLGFSADDALGRRIDGWLRPAEPSRTGHEGLADLYAGGTTQRETEYRDASGALIPVEIRIATLRDESGRSAGLLTVVRDIRDRKASERMIRTLNQEIIHRSKNQFAVIQGIARSTARYSDPKIFIDVFSHRLNALARNLNLLDQRSDAATDVASLVANQLEHLGDDYAGRMIVEGPGVVIHKRAAEALGMAVFELSTNAVKYGALSEPFAETGRLRISWDVPDGASGPIVFNWVETGLSDVRPPTGSGFGSRLTGVMLERSTQGVVTADYRPGGLVWSVRLPADVRVAA